MAERSARRNLHLPTVLVVVLLLLGVAPAQGAAPAQATPVGVVTLRSQTTWWQPDQPFSLTLGVQATNPDALEVAVSIYDRLPTRTAFTSTIAGRVAGRPVEAPTVVPMAALASDDRGDVVVTLMPSLRSDGVHPVRVELRPLGGGPAVASFLTHLVNVPAELPGDELSVATVLPIHARPAVGPDGEVSIDDTRAELLADLAAGLHSHPGVGLSMAPTPETIEALSTSPRDEDRDTLATLVRSVEGRQVLAGPFVPINLTAMIEGGLEEESAGQLTRGTEVLRTRLHAEPTTSTRLIDDRLSDPAIANLQTAQQVTKLVVPETLLKPVSRNTTLTSTFAIESRRGPVAAAVADAGLASHFSEPNPVLAAQRLLADLAVIYNDHPPGLRRGVIVVPARSWEPSAAFVNAFLSGLEDSPILRGVGLDAFFDSVAPAVSGTGSRATPLVRAFGDAPAGAAPAAALPTAAIAGTRRRIEAFGSAVDQSSPAGRTVLDRLDRTLLAAESSDLRTRDRTRYLAGTDEQLADQTALVTMPQNRSITLTARDGEIPVTISNRLGYPVQVVLRVIGDTLEFPDGDTHDLALARENTTSQFTVRAQSSGSFPIRVRIETPDGLVLAESRFTVRSTAISGVGTALSVGAAVFLVIWWGKHLRGRRSKRLVPA